MRSRAALSPLTWLGGLLGLYLLVPIGLFVVRLGRSDNRGFGEPGLWGALRTSAEAASISTAIIVLLGIPLAYWLANSRRRIATAVGVLVYLPLALPPVMSGIVLIYVVGPYTALGELLGGRLTDSLAGVVLAQTFVASPFLVVAARTAFAGVDPTLHDRAAALGHRPMARFWRVDLPIAAPGIRAGLLLTWLRALGEYGATVLLAYHPYTLPVFTEVQFASAGLATTQAPTALALLLAAGALLINRLRWPARWRTSTRLQAPQHPPVLAPTPLRFDIDATVGDFHLRLAHNAGSHRIAILGPSGSGKSVTLRCLAGLQGPGAGEVVYGSTDVTSACTEDRHVGYVPQGLELLPGRTVWQQLLFGKDSDPAVAAWWLAALHLDRLGDRLPSQLSGGQRQRVSLAQALSRNPRVLLLDEPFSALDAPVRDELRRELRRLQQQVGLSTVLVTHDPEEAAMLADEILVIAHGRLLQSGTRQEVYARPASPEVARLLGIQNINTARVHRTDVLLADGLPVTAPTGRLLPGTAVLWSIRPEHIHLTAGHDQPGDATNCYRATVTDLADIGTLILAVVRLDGGLELRIRTTDPVHLEIGETCQVRLEQGRVNVWPRPVAAAPTGASSCPKTIDQPAQLLKAARAVVR